MDMRPENLTDTMLDGQQIAFYESARLELAEMLDGYRIGHSERTAEMCEQLAFAHRVDPFRARMAGLLHDCGKDIALDILQDAEAPELEFLDEETVRMEALHHSVTSAYLARTQFNMNDEEILHAICFHTTGAPEFGNLGIVLYLSDYLEPGRDFSERKQLERKAFSDLRGTCLEVIDHRIARLMKTGREVHPRTEAFRDSLM